MVGRRRGRVLSAVAGWWRESDACSRSLSFGKLNQLFNSIALARDEARDPTRAPFSAFANSSSFLERFEGPRYGSTKAMLGSMKPEHLQTLESGHGYMWFLRTQSSRPLGPPSRENAAPAYRLLAPPFLHQYVRCQLMHPTPPENSSTLSRYPLPLCPHLEQRFNRLASHGISFRAFPLSS